MPDAYEIIKKRWPEVVLIVFLQAALMMLMEQVWSAVEQEAAGSGAGQPSPGVEFVMGFGTIAIVIIAQMLYLGFLKTACTDGAAPREPGVILRIGRSYFWRVLRFQLIIGVVYIALSIFIVSLLGPLFSEGKGLEDFPKWLHGVSSLLAFILLIKPLTLSPALMVGCDMMALESIGATRRHRIFGERKVLPLCIAALVMISAISVVLDMFKTRGTLRYLEMGCCAVAAGTALLAVHLEALRLVTSGREPAPNAQDSATEVT